MPHWFIYVILSGFALTSLANVGIGLVDEAGRRPSWKRRLGVVGAVLLAALGCYLAIADVISAAGAVCGTAVGILTDTPDPATLAVDELTRARYQDCYDRRRLQMAAAAISLIAGVALLAVTRRRRVTA